MIMIVCWPPRAALAASKPAGQGQVKDLAKAKLCATATAKEALLGAAHPNQSQRQSPMMLTKNCPFCIALLGIVIAAAASDDAIACSSNGNDRGVNHRCFADGLTKKLFKDANTNECSSSLGVSMAFDLVLPGMSEKWAEQTRKVLGFPAPASDGGGGLVWAETVKRLDGTKVSRTTTSSDDAMPLLHVANSIWLDSNSSMVPQYAGIVHVGEYAHQIDFSDRSAGSLVNDWVEDNTNGKFTSIVQDGRVVDLLVAVSAIYLKAAWSVKFKKEDTTEDVFYSSPTRKSRYRNAYFMHQVEHHAYSHDALPDYQVLKLPFKNTDHLSMIIVLPFKDGAAMATSAEVLMALPHLENAEIALALPRFKFESFYEDILMKALRSLGKADPLSLRDLAHGSCGIMGNIIQLSFIDVNESFIAVNEDDANAVAVADVGAVPDSAFLPERATLFRADHPFQFFVYNSDEDLVIFEGRVGDPGPVGDAPPSSSHHGNHDDGSVWSSMDSILPKDPFQKRDGDDDFWESFRD